MTEAERMANAHQFRDKYYGKHKTQVEMVLEYMERYGSITPLEALIAIGSLRLSARIWDIKHSGYAINKEIADGEQNYAIYSPRIRKESRKMEMNWIRRAEKQPDQIGEYIVATEYGGVKTLRFTPVAGWNTYVDFEGILHEKNRIPDRYVIAWMALPEYPQELKAEMDCPSSEAEEW